MCYALEVDFSRFEDGDILALDALGMALAAMHHRHSCKSFRGTPADAFITSCLAGRDFIIAPASDDARLSAAMQLFAEDALTDEGLEACVHAIEHGTQVVALTQKACAAIEVITERAIYEDEARETETYSRRTREEARQVTRDIQQQYRGRGRYLSDIQQELASAHPCGAGEHE